MVKFYFNSKFPQKRLEECLALPSKLSALIRVLLPLGRGMFYLP